MTRAQRDALILRAHRNGWTYARIADRYGVTRQRAWQIVTKAAKPVTDNKLICECGHHRAVHLPKCTPWSDPGACSCERFVHTAHAKAGKDIRVQIVTKAGKA